MISTRGKVNFYKVSRTLSWEEQRCRCLHFFNNMNKSSYKHLKWPWPEPLALHIAGAWLNTTWLWSQFPPPSSFFTQVSFNTGTGFPFQAQTSFFYTWTLCIVFCCQKQGCVIKALVPALLNTSGWIPLFSFPAVMQKKKEIIPSSLNSWHTWSRLFPNQHATSSRTDTKYYSFSFFMLPPGFRGNINHSGKGEKENVFLGSI